MDETTNQEAVPAQKITSIKAIREFFNTPGYPPVDLAELKRLTPQEREDLGKLAAKAIGKEWVELD